MKPFAMLASLCVLCGCSYDRFETERAINDDVMVVELTDVPEGVRCFFLTRRGIVSKATNTLTCVQAPSVLTVSPCTSVGNPTHD